MRVALECNPLAADRFRRLVLDEYLLDQNALILEDNGVVESGPPTALHLGIAVASVLSVGWRPATNRLPRTWMTIDQIGCVELQ